MIKFISILTLIFVITSCKQAFEHPKKAYFYPYKEEAKIYVFRDQKNPISEKFLRVFGIEDSEGKHIVVEHYTMDGRLTEAYNYYEDSLTLLDHMVVDVNRVNEKALLMKNTWLPKGNEQTWFASKFKGFNDSTVILSELKRKWIKSKPFKSTVLAESVNTISSKDNIRLTQINPFTKKERAQELEVISYFAENIGLVRYHDVNQKTDYVLERILTQQEFVNLMQKR